MTAWLARGALIVTAGLGLLGLLDPRGALSLVGLALDPARPEGISEIRASYGGLFLALGAIGLWRMSRDALLLVGGVWAAIFCARAFSTLIDGVPVSANAPGFAVEGTLAAILLLAALRR